MGIRYNPVPFIPSRLGLGLCATMSDHSHRITTTRCLNLTQLYLYVCLVISLLFHIAINISYYKLWLQLEVAYHNVHKKWVSHLNILITSE
jgi:hypothetical protein